MNFAKLSLCVVVLGACLLPGRVVLAQSAPSQPAPSLPSMETVQSLLKANWFRVDAALTPESVAAAIGDCEKPLIPENKVAYYWPKAMPQDVPGLPEAKGALSFFDYEAAGASRILMAVGASSTDSGYFAKVSDLSHLRLHPAKISANYTVGSFANEYTYSATQRWQESHNLEVLKTVPYELAISNALLEETHIMFSSLKVGETSYGLLYHPVGSDGAILPDETHQFLRCNGLEGVILPKASP